MWMGAGWPVSNDGGWGGGKGSGWVRDGGGGVSDVQGKEV